MKETKERKESKELKERKETKGLKLASGRSFHFFHLTTIRARIPVRPDEGVPAVNEPLGEWPSGVLVRVAPAISERNERPSLDFAQDVVN